MTNRAVVAKDFQGPGGYSMNTPRPGKVRPDQRMPGKPGGSAKGAGDFARLGISKPMMAPAAVLAPNSMFDSKTAIFGSKDFPKAS